MQLVHFENSQLFYIRTLYAHPLFIFLSLFLPLPLVPLFIYLISRCAPGEISDSESELRSQQREKRASEGNEKQTQNLPIAADEGAIHRQL